jgi:serine/threonine-protein kinase TTK/MPS1
MLRLLKLLNKKTQLIPNHLLFLSKKNDKIIISKISEKFFNIVSKKKQFNSFIKLLCVSIFLKPKIFFIKNFLKIHRSFFQLNLNYKLFNIYEKDGYNNTGLCRRNSFFNSKTIFSVNKISFIVLLKIQNYLNPLTLFFLEILESFFRFYLFYKTMNLEEYIYVDSKFSKKSLISTRNFINRKKNPKKFFTIKKIRIVNPKNKLNNLSYMKIFNFFNNFRFKIHKKLKLFFFMFLKKSSSNLQIENKNIFWNVENSLSYHSELWTSFHQIFSNKISWNNGQKVSLDHSKNFFLRVEVREKNYLYINHSLYLKLKILGKGGSGKVYKILRNDGKIFALKKNKVKEFKIDIIHNFINEIVVLKLLSKKSNIIRMEDAEVNFKKHLVYIILEFGEFDLETFFAKKKHHLDFPQIKIFWKQILAAVREIHEERIVHGDLKPSNFLFIEKNLKLIDFGISKPIGSNTTNITRDIHIGTINYMSPEAILEIPGILENIPRFKTSRSSDIWSLGCILYQLSHGYSPFRDFSMIQKIHAIINNSLKIKYNSFSPVFLTDIIKNCLKRHPDFRPTVQELLDHPFIIYDSSFFETKNNYHCPW